MNLDPVVHGVAVVVAKTLFGASRGAIGATFFVKGVGPPDAVLANAPVGPFIDLDPTPTTQLLGAVVASMTLSAPPAAEAIINPTAVAASAVVRAAGNDSGDTVCRLLASCRTASLSLLPPPHLAVRAALGGSAQLLVRRGATAAVVLLIGLGFVMGVVLVVCIFYHQQCARRLLVSPAEVTESAKAAAEIVNNAEAIEPAVSHNTAAIAKVSEDKNLVVEATNDTKTSETGIEADKVNSADASVRPLKAPMPVASDYANIPLPLPDKAEEAALTENHVAMMVHEEVAIKPDSESVAKLFDDSESLVTIADTMTTAASTNASTSQPQPESSAKDVSPVETEAIVIVNEAGAAKLNSESVAELTEVNESADPAGDNTTTTTAILEDGEAVPAVDASRMLSDMSIPVPSTAIANTPSMPTSPVVDPETPSVAADIVRQDTVSVELVTDLHSTGQLLERVSDTTADEMTMTCTARDDATEVSLALATQPMTNTMPVASAFADLQQQPLPLPVTLADDAEAINANADVVRHSMLTSDSSTETEPLSSAAEHPSIHMATTTTTTIETSDATRPQAAPEATTPAGSLPDETTLSPIVKGGTSDTPLPLLLESAAAIDIAKTTQPATSVSHEAAITVEETVTVGPSSFKATETAYDFSFTLDVEDLPSTSKFPKKDHLTKIVAGVPSSFKVPETASVFSFAPRAAGMPSAGKFPEKDYLTPSAASVPSAAKSAETRSIFTFAPGGTGEPSDAKFLEKDFLFAAKTTTVTTASTAAANADKAAISRAAANDALVKTPPKTTTTTTTAPSIDAQTVLNQLPESKTDAVGDAKTAKPAATNVFGNASFTFTPGVAGGVQSAIKFPDTASDLAATAASAASNDPGITTTP